MSTTERILDAAEGLFARKGIGATSLRAITAEAGVNTAAIHYHYGSKRALLEAVLARRIAPLNQERLKRLEQVELAAGAGPVPARALLEAFLAPVMAFREELGDSGRTVGSLVAWLRIESEPDSADVAEQHFAEVRARFAEAARRARADLTLEEATERLEYAVGAMGHVLFNGGVPSAERTAALSARVEKLIDFLAAGFEVPGGGGGGS